MSHNINSQSAYRTDLGWGWAQGSQMGSMCSTSLKPVWTLGQTHPSPMPIHSSISPSLLPSPFFKIRNWPDNQLGTDYVHLCIMFHCLPRTARPLILGLCWHTLRTDSHHTFLGWVVGLGVEQKQRTYHSLKLYNCISPVVHSTISISATLGLSYQNG